MVRLKTTCFVLIVACLIWAARSAIVDGQGRGNRVAVYEGARLITGDGSAPIENSAFLVGRTTRSPASDGRGRSRCRRAPRASI